MKTLLLTCLFPLIVLAHSSFERDLCVPGENECKKMERTVCAQLTHLAHYSNSILMKDFFKSGKLFSLKKTLKEPHMRAVVDEMLADKSFEPLHVYLLSSRNTGQGWTGRVYEAAHLLFLTYNLFFDFANSKQQHKVSLYSLLLLYAQVASLPWPQLFEALNACYSQMMVILETYHVPAEEKVSWNEYYWWVWPVTAASISVAFIQWYREHRSLQKSFFSVA